MSFFIAEAMAEPGAAAGLSKGDEVVVSGGMMGKVVKVTDEYVVVDVANNVEISFQKASITAILPKGTLKSI
jgi:preprotein translocase subunit YajC